MGRQRFGLLKTDESTGWTTCRVDDQRPSPPARGGEGRGEEGRVYWVSPLPGPLPTPASWGEGIHRAVLRIPQSPDQSGSFRVFVGFNRSFGFVNKCRNSRLNFP